MNINRRFLGFSIRQTLLLVALLALPMAFYGRIVKPFQDHRAWYDRVQADLETLANKRPLDLSRDEWSFIVASTLNAHGNRGSHPSFLANKEMAESFADELELKLQGPVTIQTIDWIWDAYMQFTNLKSYNQYRPTTPENLREGRLHRYPGVDVD